MQILALLVLFLQAVSSWKLFKNVIVADDSNYEDIIHSKGKYSFINFYSKKCTHCNKLGPQFAPLATLFNNTAVQIVQLEGLENKRVRKKENLVGFPVLRLYAFDGTHIASFTGERTTQEMAKFITDHTGVQPKELVSNVVKISDDNASSLQDNIDSELTSNNKNVLIAFVPEWNKDWELAGFYEELAAANKDNTSFFQFNDQSSEWLRLFRIDTFPTIIYLKSGNPIESTQLSVLQPQNDKETVTKRMIELLLKGVKGEKYSSLEELHKAVEFLEEDDEYKPEIKRGFNKVSHGVSPEQEAEQIRRLREF